MHVKIDTSPIGLVEIPIMIDQKTNYYFASVPSFFKEKIQACNKGKYFFQGLGILLGAGAVICAVTAPFVGLQMAATACVMKAVGGQSYRSFKDIQLRQNALLSVPISNEKEFIDYLRNESTRTRVEKRLNTISNTYRSKTGRRIFVGIAAIAALTLSAFAGQIFVPICMGIVMLGEASAASSDNKALKEFSARRWATNTTENLARLANETDRKLQLAKTIEIIEKPQTDTQRSR